MASAILFLWLVSVGFLVLIVVDENQALKRMTPQERQKAEQEFMRDRD